MQKIQSKIDLPDRRTQAVLNGLTRSPFGFALCRLPWADSFRLVLQASGEVEQLASIRGLNGKAGFVMAPFRLSAAHPLVLIRPDVTADGWGEISRALDALELGEDAFISDTAGVFIPDTSIPDDAGASVSDEVDSASAPFVSEETERARYTEAFGRFIEPLRSGRFQKLVLSRSATRRLDDGFAPLTAFVQACNRYPRMMTYLCHTPASGTWIGSTPEILLSGQDTRWNTVALAGTMPMQGEVMPTDWSRKNREEQAYVADYIRRILQRYAESLTECAPYTARAGQVVHLKTDFGFRLPSTHCLGDLLHELHPTPAVCGLPKEDAFRFIPLNEGYERSYYSGFVGMLDPGGETHLYVNLRCMALAPAAAPCPATDVGAPATATLYAGGGILASSDAASEWDETAEKMKTMQSIIRPDERA